MENETRERMIAIIEQVQREAKDTVGSMNGGFAAWYADKLLAAGVAPVQGWIPVTERLPDPNVKVGIFAKWRGIYLGWYTERHGFDHEKGFECEYGFVRLEKVTHWMPLPEKPKEEHDA